MLRPYNNVTGAAPFESLMIADIGDIPINTYSLAATVDIIRKHIAAIANLGCKPLILGGDHTITYPILQGIKVKVLFDIHCLISLDKVIIRLWDHHQMSLLDSRGGLWSLSFTRYPV